MISEAFVRTGRLTFDRVSFAYPSRPQTAVLRGVSFGAEPGRVCAVVGASGFTGPGVPGYEPPATVALYMKENLGSVDFRLTDAEVRTISALAPA